MGVLGVMLITSHLLLYLLSYSIFLCRCTTSSSHKLINLLYSFLASGLREDSGGRFLFFSFLFFFQIFFPSTKLLWFRKFGDFFKKKPLDFLGLYTLKKNKIQFSKDKGVLLNHVEQTLFYHYYEQMNIIRRLWHIMWSSKNDIICHPPQTLI